MTARTEHGIADARGKVVPAPLYVVPDGLIINKK
jgi:hypothetical protein